VVYFTISLNFSQSILCPASLPAEGLRTTYLEANNKPKNETFDYFAGNHRMGAWEPASLRRRLWLVDVIFFKRLGTSYK